MFIELCPTILTWSWISIYVSPFLKMNDSLCQGPTGSIRVRGTSLATCLWLLIGPLLQHLTSATFIQIVVGGLIMTLIWFYNLKHDLPFVGCSQVYLLQNRFCKKNQAVIGCQRLFLGTKLSSRKLFRLLCLWGTDSKTLFLTKNN